MFNKDTALSVQSLDESTYLLSVLTINNKDIYKIAPSYSYSPAHPSTKKRNHKQKSIKWEPFHYDSFQDVFTAHLSWVKSILDNT